MKAIWTRWAVVGAIFLMVSGCAFRRPHEPLLTVDQMIQEGNARGLDLVNPFALDDAI